MSKQNDDSDRNLSGATTLATAEVGSNTYIFAGGQWDNGISVFGLAGNGLSTSVYDVSDDATINLSGVRGISTAEVGGTSYLFTAGSFDDGISVFSIANDGSLTNVDNTSDNATLELLGAQGLTTTNIGGVTFLFTTGNSDDGVSVFEVASDGTLTNVDNVIDDTTLELNGARELITAEVEGVTYLFVTGDADDGMSAFEVATDGTLTNVENISDNGTLSFRQCCRTYYCQRWGNHLPLCGRTTDDGISVFR